MIVIDNGHKLENRYTKGSTVYVRENFYGNEMHLTSNNSVSNKCFKGGLSAYGSYNSDSLTPYPADIIHF